MALPTILPNRQHMRIHPLLWSRFFFFRFIKLTALIIFLSYLLFVIADMVGHMKDIFDPATSKKMWLIYYGAMLSRRLDILIPFSAGIAAIIMLSRATAENVIIPLLCAGLSVKRFLLPFFAGALLYTSLCWINFEFFFPHALQKHLFIVETDFGREKPKESDQKKLGVIMLTNGERLFFKEHNRKKQLLTDIFWVISRNHICHIEELNYSLEGAHPKGTRIEQYTRGENGLFTLTATAKEETLESLMISDEQIKIATAQPREISLSNLYKLSRCYANSKTERANETKIALYSKTLTPFLSLFAVILAACVTLHFDRKVLSTSRALAILIAALFCIQVIIQAATVLARSPFVPTTFILCLPWILISYLSLRHLKKL